MGETMAKILVIEDTEGMRNMMALMLGQSGHAVDVAVNGLEGQHALDTDSYDLVITDVFMPESDGFDVLRHMKSKEIKTPVIVMSGGSPMLSADWALRGASVLANETLQKPFQKTELVSAVSRCLAS